MADVLLVGIDLGTSSVKVEVYGSDGKLMKSGSAPITRQDTGEWLEALRRATPVDLLKSWSGDKIVSVDSTSGSFVIVDRFGQPLHPPVMYYEKAVDEYEKIKGLPSVRKLAEKGISITPGSPHPKLLRIAGVNPGILEKARWIVPPATWLLYRLMVPEGSEWRDVAVDYSNALKFGADITLSTPRWFEPLYEELGLPLEKMPRIVECGDYAGDAESRLAEELGLRGARLHHGMTDGNAAALASGALKPGDMSIYTGSTTVPKFVAEEMRLNPAIYYHRHPVKG
ncbi:MAG: xylulose kinase, partial [Thermoprotei archaeon]